MSDYADEIADRLQRDLNDKYGLTLVQMVGGSFGNARIIREAMAQAAREGYALGYGAAR